MSGRLYLLGLGLALVAAAFVLTDAVLGPHPGVTEANVRRIRAGMLQGEVEALLGGPPLRTLDLDMNIRIRPHGPDEEPTRWVAMWRGPTGDAIVQFNRPGGVDCAEFWPTFDQARPCVHPLVRLRVWLGW
jgi:hypothetical protein